MCVYLYVVGIYVCYGMNACRGQSKVFGSECSPSTLASGYDSDCWTYKVLLSAEISCWIFLPVTVSSDYLLIWQSGGVFPIHSFILSSTQELF